MCVYEALLQHTQCVKVSSCSSDVMADVQPLWWWRGWATVTDFLLRRGCQPFKPLPFEYFPSVYSLSLFLSPFCSVCLAELVSDSASHTCYSMSLVSLHSSRLSSSLTMEAHHWRVDCSSCFLLFSPLHFILCVWVSTSGWECSCLRQRCWGLRWVPCLDCWHCVVSPCFVRAVRRGNLREGTRLTQRKPNPVSCILWHR